MNVCIKRCHPLAEYSIGVISGIFLGLGLIYYNVPVILLSICIIASILTHRDPFSDPLNPSMVFTYCFISSILTAYIVKLIVRQRKNKKVSDTIKSKYR